MKFTGSNIEFEVGQKYRIVDIDAWWNKDMYHKTVLNGVFFKNGDVIEVEIATSGKLHFALVGKECVYSEYIFSIIQTSRWNDSCIELITDDTIHTKDNIYFAKLREDAIIPSKRDEDGGMDVYAVTDEEIIVILPNQTIMLNTGIISAFDKKYRIVLAERGSTGTKGIGQRAGIIDSGYRGEWKVPITNHNDIPLIIYNDRLGFNHGGEFGFIYYPISKAICQALVEEVPQVNVVELTSHEILGIASERGDGMLGSSNK